MYIRIIICNIIKVKIYVFQKVIVSKYLYDYGRVEMVEYEWLIIICIENIFEFVFILLRKYFLIWIWVT